MSKREQQRAIGKSHTLQTHLVSPQDTNHLNTIFGGNILAYIDEAAAIAAMRHSGEVVVTASVDSVDFHASVRKGEIVIVQAWVASTGRSSMLIYVHVSVENPITHEVKTTTTSFVTMVAIDENGKSTEVPGVYAETQTEHDIVALANDRTSR
ncbi:acyl-CoA thioesterase [Geomicrobium sp. JCM 19039]|uniref:acyl-CoA thioesterase n=1 Tax=Geomicrobium sp. JCM 19039 TaxID=1460636 RepID=UPI00045F1213|nr:acyl-CoA thioesterase [Geomicrobium sp. JCM 19039]GAK13765.1 acyl-CoA thioester hydrolase [Geomicrobium sp. JCM 19039]